MAEILTAIAAVIAAIAAAIQATVALITLMRDKDDPPEIEAKQ